MSTRDIHLHLGVHKTASTHLQRSFWRSTKALAGAGAAFMPTRDFRLGLGQLQYRLRDGAPLDELRARAEADVVAATGGDKRLILSDENIAGTLPHVAKGQRFYLWIKPRLTRTVSVLNADRLRLFVAIRSPATFLPSAYSESHIHYRFQPFETFLTNIQLEGLSWVPMIEDIRAAAPDAPLTVWRYEDYAKDPAPMATALLGQPLPKGFKFVKRRPRPGLSARATEALGAWAAEGRDLHGEKLIAEAASRWPKGEEFPVYDPLSDAQKAMLAETYARDIARIKAMPGVTLLR